jgi:anti-sigma-K factor RskA
MKDEHIIELLESGPLARLSSPERERIEAHLPECDPCHRAYDAARLAEQLLRTRAAEFVPNPFFATRVMAAWRERQAAGELWSFRRLWRSTGALVSSMAATVAVLLVLTFALPGTTTTPPVAQANGYSAEEVIVDGDSADLSRVSDSQAVAAILDADDDGQ